MLLITLGILTAMSLILLCARLGLRRVFGYGFLTDLIMMILLGLLFHGTYSGMVVAAIAGLTCSLAIYIMRRQIGFERYSFSERRWVAFPPDPIDLPDWLVRRRKRSVLATVGLTSSLFSTSFVAFLALANLVFGYAVSFALPFVGAAAAALTTTVIRYV